MAASTSPGAGGRESRRRPAAGRRDGRRPADHQRVLLRHQREVEVGFGRLRPRRGDRAVSPSSRSPTSLANKDQRQRLRGRLEIPRHRHRDPRPYRLRDGLRVPQQEAVGASQVDGQASDGDSQVHPSRSAFSSWVSSQATSSPRSPSAPTLPTTATRGGTRFPSSSSPFSSSPCPPWSSWCWANEPDGAAEDPRLDGRELVDRQRDRAGVLHRDHPLWLSPGKWSTNRQDLRRPRRPWRRMGAASCAPAEARVRRRRRGHSQQRRAAAQTG